MLDHRQMIEDRIRMVQYVDQKVPCLVFEDDRRCEVTPASVVNDSQNVRKMLVDWAESLVNEAILAEQREGMSADENQSSDEGSVQTST